MSLFKFGNLEMEIDFTDVDVAKKAWKTRRKY